MQRPTDYANNRIIPGALPTSCVLYVLYLTPVHVPTSWLLCLMYLTLVIYLPPVYCVFCARLFRKYIDKCFKENQNLLQEYFSTRWMSFWQEFW